LTSNRSVSRMSSEEEPTITRNWPGSTMRRRFLSYSARSSAVNRNVQVFVSPGSMAKLGEAAELLDGRRHAADHVLEVELDGLLAGTVAGVFYLELNHEPFGRSDCPCAQSKPAILELGVLPRQPRSAQILTADSVQQQPIAAPEGSEINHGIHRNTRKRESESTSPFRVLPFY